MRKNTKNPSSTQIFAQILDQASVNSKQSQPSVTDLLHSYDQILMKSKISPSSTFGQELYKKILQYSRQQNPRIAESSLGDDINNENFNLLNLGSSRSEKSFDLSTSFKDMKENRSLKSQNSPSKLTYSPSRSLSSSETNSTCSQHSQSNVVKLPQLDFNTWGKLYKNPYLSDRNTSIREGLKIGDLISKRSTDRVDTLQSDFRIAKRDEPQTSTTQKSTAAEAKLRNPLTYESFHRISTQYFSASTADEKPENQSYQNHSLSKDFIKPFETAITFDDGAIESLKEKNTEAKINFFKRKISDRRVSLCFSALYRNIASTKVLRNGISTISNALNRQVKKNSFYKMINAQNEITHRENLADTFNYGMKLNNASEYFKIWRYYTIEKRTDKINKNLSKYNHVKKTLKSIWNAWKKITSLEKFYNRLSWDLHQEYKKKLVLKGLKGFKHYFMSKKIKEKARNKLENKIEYFQKRRALLWFSRSSIQRQKDTILERKSYEFFRQQSIKLFFQLMPPFIHFSRLHKYQNFRAAHQYFHKKARKCFNLLKSETARSEEVCSTADIIGKLLVKRKVFTILKIFRSRMRNNRLPENPLAIFICYKLLQKTNLSSIIEPNYILESYDPYILPRVFRIPSQRKKQMKYLGANLKLNSFVKNIVFKSWRRTSQASLDFKKSLNLKTLSSFFAILKEYSDKRIINRFQLNKHLKSKHQKISSLIFGSWLHHTSEKIQLRSLYSSYTQSRNREQLSDMFNHWDSLSKDKRRNEKSEQAVTKYIRRKLLTKHFKSIIQYAKKYIKIKKASEIYKAKSIHTSGKKFMLKLKEFYRNMKIHHARENLSNQFRQRILKEKCFAQWILSKDIFSKQHECALLLQEQSRIKLLLSIFKNWERLTECNKEKRDINKYIRNECLFKLYKKAFFTLQQYALNSIAKRKWKVRTGEMIINFQKKRTLKKWIKKYEIHSGCRYFHHLFKKLNMRTLFLAYKNKIEKNNQIIIYSDQRKLISYVKKIFGILKSLSIKHKRLQRVTHMWNRNMEIKVMSQMYSHWRRLYLFEKNSALLVARTLIDIKNTNLEKYFKILRRKWEISKIVYYCSKVKELKTKKSCLLGLKKMVLKRKHLSQASLLFNQKSKYNLMKNYLMKCGRVFSKRMHNYKLGKLIHLRRKFKFLKAWIEWYDISIILNTKVSTKKLPERFVSVVFTVYQEKLLFLIDLSLISKWELNPIKSDRDCSKKYSFDLWKAFVHNKNMIRKKIWKFRNKGGNFAKECFSKWHTLLKLKMKLANSLDNLFTVAKKQVRSMAFKSIFNFVQKDKLLNERVQSYSDKKLMLLIRSSFLAIKTLSLNRKMKKLKTEQAANSNIYNLMKTSFITWLQYIANKNSKVINEKKAQIISYLKIAKKSFYFWKQYYLKKLILRATIKGYQKVRLRRISPLFFQQVKLNYYLDSYKKIAYPKAEAFHTKLYKIKPFLSLKMNAIRSIQKKTNEINAKEFNEMAIKNKVFSRLVNYSVRKLNTREIRESKIEECQQKIGFKTKSKIVKIWKNYLKEQSHYQKIMTHHIIKNKKIKIINSWKNYAQNCTQEKDKLNALLNVTNQKNMQKCLEIWKKVFRAKMILIQAEQIFSKKIKNLFFIKLHQNSENFILKEQKELALRKSKAYLYFFKIKKYYTFLKDLNIKSQDVLSRKSHENLGSYFKTWRRLFKIFNFKKSSEKRKIQKVFGSWNRYSQRRINNRENQRNYLMRMKSKVFELLIKYSSDRKAAITTLYGLIYKKEDMNHEIIQSKFSTWVSVVLDTKDILQKSKEAKIYCDKKVLDIYFNSIKNFAYSSRVLKKAVSILAQLNEKNSNFKSAIAFNNIVQCWNKSNKLARALQNLTRFALIESKSWQKLTKLSFVSKKLINFSNRFKRMKVKLLKYKAFHHILNEIKDRDEKFRKAIDYLFLKKVVQLKKILFHLRIFSQKSAKKKQNISDAEYFYNTKILTNFLKILFANWKVLSQNEESVKHRELYLRKKLSFDRKYKAFDFFKKFAIKNKQFRQKTDPSNPKLLNFLKKKIKGFLSPYFSHIRNLVLKRKEMIRNRNEYIEKKILQKEIVYKRVCFKILKSLYQTEKAKSARSKLYSVFFSWKMYAREKILLKKYLKEGDYPEELAYSPNTTQRKRLFEATRPRDSHFSASHLSGLSSEMNHTFNTGENSSPDRFDKFNSTQEK